MSFSIRSIIRELVAPEHIISCSRRLWTEGLHELRIRGEGKRESGAFLIGTSHNKRRILRFVYYDDLEPGCLDTGAVVFRGSGYGPLWNLCKETGLSVVADIHTHPGMARQSILDKVNPMVASHGHIALIVPNYAKEIAYPEVMGIYEYLGSHQWRAYSGKSAKRYLYVGAWG